MRSRTLMFVAVGVTSCVIGTVAKTEAAGIDADSERVLREMTSFMATIKTVRTELIATFNVEAGGVASKLTYTYGVAAEGPNRVAAVPRSGQGAPVVICDGDQLYTFMPSMGKYVLGKPPVSFKMLLKQEPVEDTSVVHPVFAAALMPLVPYNQLEKSFDEATFVGEEKIGTMKCNHLKITQDSYDWDVWIDTGKKPLPRKVVPDVSKWLTKHRGPLPNDATADVQILFKTWTTGVALKDKDFAIATPAAATEVSSLTPEPGQKENPAELLKGKPAPPFQLPLLAGGAANIAAHKGKEVVILDFWATWCGPCVKALPDVSEVAAEYRSKGVAFYAVNLKEGPGEVVDFLKSKQLDIPVAMDSSGNVADLYRVSGIPQTVIIDRSGIIQIVHVGLPANVKQVLSSELDAVLASGPAAKGKK